MHRTGIAPGLILSTVHCFSISEEEQVTLQAEGGAGRSWQDLVVHCQMVGTARPRQASTCAWISKKQRNLDSIWAGLRKRKVSVTSMSKHRYERNQTQKLKFLVCAVTEKCSGKNQRFLAAMHFDNTFTKRCGVFFIGLFEVLCLWYVPDTKNCCSSLFPQSNTTLPTCTCTLGELCTTVFVFHSHNEFLLPARAALCLESLQHVWWSFSIKDAGSGFTWRRNKNIGRHVRQVE